MYIIAGPLQTTFNILVSRRATELKFVIEANNEDFNSIVKQRDANHNGLELADE